MVAFMTVSGVLREELLRALGAGEGTLLVLPLPIGEHLVAQFMAE